MSDIVKRLRAFAKVAHWHEDADIPLRAANEIERLRGEKSYLEDEVIPALRNEVDRLRKE